LLGLTLYTACGDDDTTAPPDGGTPRGNFTFTITGTSGPTVHTANSILLVN
jgi:hypothetical protein